MRYTFAIASILALGLSAGPGFAQMDQRSLPSSSAIIQPVNSPADTYHPLLKVQARSRYSDKVSVLNKNALFAAALTKSMIQSGTGLPGTSLRVACEGFSFVGECVAAIHAAKALSTPGAFDALRGKMVEGDKLSLADAIKAIKPDADAKSLEKSATKKARGNCAQVAVSGY